MSKKEKKPIQIDRKKAWRLVWILSAVALILILGSICAYAFYSQERLLVRSEISGVKLGGLTKSAAIEQLQNYATQFNEGQITLRFDGKEWIYIPKDYGASFSVEKAVNDLWQQEKSGDFKAQLKRLLTAPFIPTRSEIGYQLFSVEGLESWRNTLLKGVETPYQETSLNLVPGKVEIVPGLSGKKIDQNQFEINWLEAFKTGKKQIDLTLVPFSPELTAAQAEEAKVRASAILGGSWKIGLPGGKTNELSATKLAGWLGTAPERAVTGTNQGKLGLTIDRDKVKVAVTEWATEIRKKPTNARIALVNGTVQVATEGTAGADLDLDASIQELVSKLVGFGQAAVDNNSKSSERSVTLVGKTVLPDVRKDSLAALGLTEMIGTATTDFSGSPTNRKFNIGVGQRSLDMKLVKPGETFSTTGTLGPISTETGYLNELVIKNNRTVPEAGGGLCQVSTTLFRSVLSAGLPIIERSNHAYRVSYYERGVGPGLDATIYDPSPDLKWKNDLSSSIYIQSYINGTKLTFELYGTNDGRKSTIGKPVILADYPVGDPIMLETDTLYVGEKKQVETAHNGAKTSVTYVVNRAGKDIINRTFISVYKAWPAQYLVGTKPNPNATPTPTPTPTPDPTPTPTLTPTPSP